jgi:hypothetical protein
VAREIVHYPLFDEQCARARVGFPRFDQVLNGLLTAISLKADTIRFVPGTNLRTLESRSFPGLPSVAVFFIIEPDGRCSVIELRVAD